MATATNQIVPAGTADREANAHVERVMRKTADDLRPVRGQLGAGSGANANTPGSTHDRGGAT